MEQSDHCLRETHEIPRSSLTSRADDAIQVALLDSIRVDQHDLADYDEPSSIGKTAAHTDTYHGRFVRLAGAGIPDQLVASCSTAGICHGSRPQSDLL